jgi:hypothetical protein
MLGLGLSFAKLMYRMSHVEFDVRGDEDRVELHMMGAATFLALPALAEALDGIERGKELHVHFDDLTFIDHACIDLLNSYEKLYEDSGGNSYEKLYEDSGGTFVVEWDGLMHRYATGGRPMTEEAPIRPVPSRGY